MTPTEARAVANAVGEQLKNEWRTTQKVLRAIPESKRDYRPDPNSRSAWDLGSHTAGADVWFLESMLKGGFDGASNDSPAASVEALGEWYGQEFPARLDRVLALPDEKLAAPLSFFGMQMPLASLLLFTLVHMVHHRGQLSGYLRACGGKVPSIYGGSYDEPFQMPSA